MTPTIDPSIINSMPCDIVLDCTFSDNWIDNTGIFHNCYALDTDCTMECASIVRLGVYLNRESYFN